jgi:hypothetical protein
MVDLLYRFVKRPLGASPLPSEDSGLDLCARCAKLRFLRLHNGDRSTFFTSRNPDKNQDSVKFERSKP